ncbi:TPA: TcfC E-set like domain-containing protein [Photobacterium damselae]
MNKQKYLLFFGFILFVSHNALSYTISDDKIPDDFKYLFNEETKPVKIEYPDGDIRQLELTVSYNKVRFKNGSKKVKQILYKQLKKHDVKDIVARKIIEQMSKQEGLSSSEKCKGFRNTCIVLTDSFDIVYDIERNTLRFFFSKNILNENMNKEVYNDSSNYDPALINKSSFFINTSDANASISLNDSLVQGFKFGYLDAKFNLSSGDDNYIDKFVYNLDSGNKQYKLGFFSDENSMNSTDFIESFTDSDVFDVSFGSSKNLLVKSSDNNKKIHIYVPSTGLLSIKKNGTYIKQFTVNAGQQDIPYSSLPLGVYDINITVKSSNKIVFDENYTIYNTSGGQLASDEMDYRLQLGQLRDNKKMNESKSNDLDLKSFKGHTYATGKISYGLTDYIMLGGAITLADDNNSVYQLGANYLVNNSTSMRASSKFYSNGSYLVDLNIYSPLLNFGLSKFELNRGDSFAAYTEDDESNTNINISHMFSLGLNTDLGLYYNYSKYNDAVSSNLLADVNHDINSSSRVNFQVNYNKFTDGEFVDFSDDNSLEFNLIYTYTFDSGSSIRTSLMENDDSYNEAEVEYNTADLVSDDNISLSMTGRTSINNDNDLYSLDVNGDYTNTALSMGYYGGINSDGTNNQSLSISSNQVISKSGLIFTNESSNSYLEFDIKRSKDIKSDESLGTLMLDKNGVNISHVQFDSNSKLIKLDDNNLYKSKIDTLSSSIENTGISDNVVFSHPGTVKHVKMDLTKIVSFVGAYSTILNKDVEDLKCEGDGCIDVENIEGNVYKVAVRSGKPFVLKDESTSYVCLTPQVRNIEVLNIGNSFCVPDLDTDDQAYPIALEDPESGERLNLVFLGIFSNNNKWKYASLLKSKNYDLIERKFGHGNNLVYVNIHNSNHVSHEFNEQLNKIISTADVPRNDLSKYVLLLNDNWS